METLTKYISVLGAAILLAGIVWVPMLSWHLIKEIKKRRGKK